MTKLSLRQKPTTDEMWQIVNISRMSFQEQDILTIHQVSRFLQQPDSFSKTLSDSRVHGYLMYSLRSKVVLIDQFAVHPEYRRRGLGRQLISSLQKQLRVLRRPSIVTWVDEYQVNGQLFLRDTEFKYSGTIEKGGQDYYLMVYRG